MFVLQKYCIEDYYNSITTDRFSSVPVQFLIYIYAQPACTSQPLLYGDYTPGSCLGVQVGQQFQLQLIVENNCAASGVTMRDIGTLSFPVVIKNALVQNATLGSVTLTWIPTSQEVGSQVLCSVAVDSQSVQSNQYCLTFTVGDDSAALCPGQTQEPTTTSE
ncbi:unnamed protein product [Didymodactylos carnosus]|uniref:Uncharacterized protein n=1 Tax=Didymodactylos carnosus TaxID=1234261 RepID=A0A815JWR3_9BILA|nr:unnamed protein product [Didymodactylos carnosus]CAF1387830.1 unnamed protein product [Didymodactylos carnosus]CAF4038619.1 unnamed protein product [Didymodactylos carnosus]CAF4282622.1 unnamed protein product [Didymodactylos carnosus]